VHCRRTSRGVHDGEYVSKTSRNANKLAGTQEESSDATRADRHRRRSLELARANSRAARAPEGGRSHTQGLAGCLPAARQLHSTSPRYMHDEPQDADDRTCRDPLSRVSQAQFSGDVNTRFARGLVM